MAIEEEFNIELPDEEAEGIMSVKQAVEKIASKWVRTPDAAFRLKGCCLENGQMLRFNFRKWSCWGGGLHFWAMVLDGRGLPTCAMPASRTVALSCWNSSFANMTRILF